MCQMPRRRSNPGVLLRVGAMRVLGSALRGSDDRILCSRLETVISRAKVLKWRRELSSSYGSPASDLRARGVGDDSTGQSVLSLLPRSTLVYSATTARQGIKSLYCGALGRCGTFAECRHSSAHVNRSCSGYRCQPKTSAPVHEPCAKRSLDGTPNADAVQLRSHQHSLGRLNESPCAEESFPPRPVT
jgi:hypothetical protein